MAPCPARHKAKSTSSQCIHRETFTCQLLEHQALLRTACFVWAVGETPRDQHATAGVWDGGSVVVIHMSDVHDVRGSIRQL